jgi:alpha-tubulin suppressor-like RCC1 family protein
MRAAGNLTAAEVSASGIGTGSASHTCMIASNRLTVYCFGRNDVGQLGNGATTAETSVNSGPVIVAGQKPH